MSNVAKGGDWGYQVLYDPEADGVADQCIIDPASLMDDMMDKLDDDEMIQEIWVYKKPLTEVQKTQLLLNHQFVVLKTTNTPAPWPKESIRWWSIEKDGEQIVIRKARSVEAVRDSDLQGPRITPVEKMSHDQGTKSMKDLIVFLFDKDELWKTYHWLTDNCQQFAKRVFDEFAYEKKHDIVMGS